MFDGELSVSRIGVGYVKFRCSELVQICRPARMVLKNKALCWDANLSTLRQ